MIRGGEQRRSERIPGRFWIAVEGVDRELLPRRGDISVTGIFFEHERDLGLPGTVHWLHVQSWDRTRAVALMAHVVRSADAGSGIALEFMPESDEASSDLRSFVQYVVEHDVKNLSVQTLLLETDWAVAVGEPVRVEIIARGVKRPIRVEGRAVSVHPSGPRDSERYRIAVQVSSELEGPLRRFSTPEMAAVTPPPALRHHLTGLLSRIPFTSLCQLVELERLSGVLTVQRPRGGARIFVREGRFVDVEPAEDPRRTIAEILGSREGAFDFDVAAVDRTDRVRAGMTELLLDLARAADEAAR